jgi:hypothetical protein
VLISISAVLWFASFIGFKLPANFLGNSTMVPIAKQAGGSGYRVLASLIPLRDEPGKAIQKWFLEDKDLAKNKSEKILKAIRLVPNTNVNKAKNIGYMGALAV